MGRKQLNHVQYKRNVHPDFVDKMDKHLNKLKGTEVIIDVRKYAKEKSEEYDKDRRNAIDRAAKD